MLVPVSALLTCSPRRLPTLDKGCTGASSRGRARAHDAVVHAQDGAQLALHKRLHAPPPAGGRHRGRARLSAACARAQQVAARGHAAHVALSPLRLEDWAGCQRPAPARPAASGLAGAHSAAAACLQPGTVISPVCSTTCSTPPMSPLRVDPQLSMPQVDSGESAAGVSKDPVRQRTDGDGAQALRIDVPPPGCRPVVDGCWRARAGAARQQCTARRLRLRLCLQAQSGVSSDTHLLRAARTDKSFCACSTHDKQLRSA